MFWLIIIIGSLNSGLIYLNKSKLPNWVGSLTLLILPTSMTLARQFVLENNESNLNAQFIFGWILLLAPIICIFFYRQYMINKINS